MENKIKNYWKIVGHFIRLDGSVATRQEKLMGMIIHRIERIKQKEMFKNVYNLLYTS